MYGPGICVESCGAPFLLCQMEETTELTYPGLRQLNLKKSFKLGGRSLLTACSKEEFSKAFPRFTAAEQESLHRLFIQVITSLHENIEDEFESLCLETQVGTILDTVEQIVEEHSLDPLSSDKTSVGDIKFNLSTAKRHEILYLKDRLEAAEEQNRLIRARIEHLKKERECFSDTSDAVQKVPLYF
ncbi:uncharacterized protein LOC131155312 isoform X1 [Malania oleifera]|uniref:uncharacterized protein LOC131155312 isoform X1 n=1 Tax=Malania oleifera TaxID=397392 RepID=UPI0025AE3350|nr:uncharacterized protein LOC131155312 isoform X1 [Malania oleifera]